MANCDVKTNRFELFLLNSRRERCPTPVDGEIGEESGGNHHDKKTRERPT